MLLFLLHYLFHVGRNTMSIKAVFAIWLPFRPPVKTYFRDSVSRFHCRIWTNSQLETKMFKNDFYFILFIYFKTQEVEEEGSILIKTNFLLDTYSENIYRWWCRVETYLFNTVEHCSVLLDWFCSYLSFLKPNVSWVCPHNPVPECCIH